MINIFKDIPNSKDWKRVDWVDKGWSGDKKYHIITEDNRQLLLRVSDISVFHWKKEEYEVMKKLDSCGILMSRPVDFGVFNDNKSVFTLLTWIDGTDAELVISSLTDEQQYRLGYNAGKALRQLHKFPAPENLEPWEEFNRIVWCAQNSSYFASGRINGYFEGDVPEEFFRLMALYIGNNTLSSVPWAVGFGEKEVNTMLNQAKYVLE